jgi:hypothetical protein
VKEINILEEWKMGNRFLVFVILLVFLSSYVSGLGVTPARTTIDFSSGLEKTVSFEVINSGSKDVRLILSVQGGLKDYISIPQKEVSMTSSEHSKTLTYNLKLPEKLEPGLHTGEVFIMEIPSGEASQEGAQVLATLAVVTQVHLYVPYPGKFANAKMVIHNANKGEDVTFVFPIVSAGEFDLTKVSANVDIYTKLGEKIDSFNTNSISVPSGMKKEIVHKWKADVPVGDYRADATLSYDEGVLNLEGTFRVGSAEVELQEISVRGFSLGQIAKLEMLVENKWSEKISDAHISTTIKNSRGDVVSSFKSASYDIEPLSKQVFVSYWDTAGVRVGDYESLVSINYGDKSSEKSLTFKVKENELIIIGLGYVVSEDGGSGAEGGTSTLIIVLVVVIALLVLLNILWFLIIRKRLRK